LESAGGIAKNGDGGSTENGDGGSAGYDLKPSDED
jgi:hypothetical protein